ncbi:putative Exosome complex exonuclease RRP44 [Paratrimastix pyriformis]|uniref:Exosome complex exonuclease RRP44 n=1 Tax=Paratrimastix pyriformis TaxID=342808 RepID=A0ABQ8ULG3_9EUKA|nr:putative Exosome complex exonuclease RRP44 [Paratrimastix pyriformis]
MSRVNQFFCRTTRRGAVLKIAREHYLREDICCGVAGCEPCSALDATIAPRKILLPPESQIDCLTIIDAPTAIRQIAFLEHPSVTDIILTQTLMDEVKRQSSNLYQRLYKLVDCPEKRFYIFLNEHCQNAFVDRLPGESLKDRNDRAVFAAMKWYDEHLSEQPRIAGRCKGALFGIQGPAPRTVVLLTDDAVTRTRAAQRDLVAYSAIAYAQTRFAGCGEVTDLVVGPEEEPTEAAGQAPMQLEGAAPETTAVLPPHVPFHFEKHRKLADLQVLVGQRKLYRGRLMMTRHNCYEAYVNVPTLRKPIIIHGVANLNRALDGDTVAVRLLPTAQWRRPSPCLAEYGSEQPDPDLLEADMAALTAAAQAPLPEEIDVIADPALAVAQPEGAEGERALPAARLAEMEVQEAVAASRGAEIEGTAQEQRKPHPTGRVVGIIRRDLRTFAGSVEVDPKAPSLPAGQLRTMLFVPVNERIPKIEIRTSQPERLVGQRAIVAIDGWLEASRYPHGHVVRVMGPTGAMAPDRDAEKVIEADVLLHEYGVPHEPFSPAVLAGVPVTPWIIPDSERERRLDLTGIDICSIDPLGCKDIDDALHARILPNGLVETGVHIADVAYFVRPDTAIDAEAANRGNTTYLVDRRFDMLPKLLTEDLCSLKGGVERFAFSCLWEMDPAQDYKIVKTTFGRSIIRSRGALHYEQAQMMMLKGRDRLSDQVRLLNKVACALKRRRMQGGALVLASPAVKFELDSETHDPAAVAQYQMFDTNSLVEEFMLLANIAVAERIYQSYPTFALLRRHPPPLPKSFEWLVATARELGVNIDVSSNKALNDSLAAAKMAGNEYFPTHIKMLATRSMALALYFASGDFEYPEFYHYGLACPIYTHFTSPIRRYAGINKRHKMSQDCGRASNRVQTVIYLQQQVLSAARLACQKRTELEAFLVEKAYVNRVWRNALVVFIPGPPPGAPAPHIPVPFGLEGNVYVGPAGSQHHTEHLVALDEDRQTICFTSVHPDLYLPSHGPHPAAAPRAALAPWDPAQPAPAPVLPAGSHYEVRLFDEIFVTVRVLTGPQYPTARFVLGLPRYADLRTHPDLGAIETAAKKERRAVAQAVKAPVTAAAAGSGWCPSTPTEDGPWLPPQPEDGAAPAGFVPATPTPSPAAPSVPSPTPAAAPTTPLAAAAPQEADREMPHKKAAATAAATTQQQGKGKKKSRTE